MNNTQEGTHSRITEAEARINDLEDKMVEITAAEQNIKIRMKRNEDSIRDLCNNIHQYSHYRCPRRRREKGPEKIFEEIIAENFPNTGKEIVNQV